MLNSVPCGLVLRLAERSRGFLMLKRLVKLYHFFDSFIDNNAGALLFSVLAGIKFFNTNKQQVYHTHLQLRVRKIRPANHPASVVS